jgi:hypothetical protein
MTWTTKCAPIRDIEAKFGKESEWLNVIGFKVATRHAASLTSMIVALENSLTPCFVFRGLPYSMMLG